MVLVIKHENGEGPGSLGAFLRRRGHRVKTVELQKGDRLPAIDDCKAVISMGGPMNVYEDTKYPFLRSENIFLRQAIDKNVPTIGICLGAQLLAKTMGANISKSSRSEFGWMKVSLTTESKYDPLFGGLPDTMHVFQWHEDTFDIPNDCALLATSDTCKNQAMKVGKYAWGLQFHPEVTPELIQEWRSAFHDKSTGDRLLDEYNAIENDYKHNSESLFINFDTIINEYANSR